ncbi:accessory gland protein Acp29AB-like [Drosophila sulfurigaster albostrigata]|uniref:accessory gland protein Acp29AB-like n=1 Tax=Drosophila sulfurigaster albostrigata TaxID=89887 RepID=UPI002D21D1E9|nr:accessory gland protein Acp29AB-like [Drosophila sulfurigaster albostrigata]
MKNNLFSILITLLAVQKCNANCEESRELESACGKYCFKVVKPFLDYMKILQSRADEIEDKRQSNTLENLTDSIDELRKTVNEEFKSINREMSSRHVETIPEKLLLLEQKSQAPTEQLFQKIGAKYYYIENSKTLNWFAAWHECLKMDAHLVSLQSEAERNALISKLTESTYWIDVNDIETEGEYISLKTGEQAPFLKWDSGEPNNMQDEDCVLLIHSQASSYYLMNDGHCVSKCNFICERK